MKEFRILSPTAILGYGFPIASFEAGLAKKPHLIAVDAGSSDPGPYYLGEGVAFTDFGAVKRDLALILKGALKLKIPLVIGTAGGSGGAPHLKWCQGIIEAIAKEERMSFKMAIIGAEFDKGYLQEALAEGIISPLLGVGELTPDGLGEATRVVGQMGVEPFIKALSLGPDVVLAGRAYDPACFASLPISKGYDWGLALHLGKILECAAICCVPGSGSDCVLGTLGDGWFEVEPLNPFRACTPASVAAHTLYEKTDPYHLPGPGGSLDLTGCRFEAIDGKVRVTGSRFALAKNYTIKLEGARKIGCRTISIAGCRDRAMIENIQHIIDGVKAQVADNFGKSLGDYFLDFIIYGRDGVMGRLEPTPQTAGCHELGIIIEAVGNTQGAADTLCSFARSTMLHFGFEGRRSTAGNLAFPYSPSDFHGGNVYAFCCYHLLKTDDPTGFFPIEMVEVGS
ncbi:MAG: DUF1446 domain-containing protein [Turicibacter sp.]|nr:DUF1446 domain-containing protein [Turicibacter sp.]